MKSELIKEVCARLNSLGLPNTPIVRTEVLKFLNGYILFIYNTSESSMYVMALDPLKYWNLNTLLEQSKELERKRKQ